MIKNQELEWALILKSLENVANEFYLVNDNGEFISDEYPELIKRVNSVIFGREGDILLLVKIQEGKQVLRELCSTVFATRTDGSFGSDYSYGIHLAKKVNIALK